MKKIEVGLNKFEHTRYDIKFGVIESEQPGVLVISLLDHLKKTHITTSLTKGDLLLLLEFLNQTTESNL